MIRSTVVLLRISGNAPEAMIASTIAAFFHEGFARANLSVISLQASVA